MVSLRRRRLLGLCCGAQNPVVDPLPMLFDEGNATESDVSNPVDVHPMPINEMVLPMEAYQANDLSGEIRSSNVSTSSQLKDQCSQPSVSNPTLSEEQITQPVAEKQVKRRKQHQRRRIHDQEQCVMRGVYFKNTKWQAAIKVDKKQIHLGTVSTQKEAAHLYDRAAFMCSREQNFELPEEEKQQLLKYKWDEFLAVTRQTYSKKNRRHGVSKATPSSVQNSNGEGSEQGMQGLSTSDYAEQSSSTS